MPLDSADTYVVAILFHHFGQPRRTVGLAFTQAVIASNEVNGAVKGFLLFRRGLFFSPRKLAGV